MKIVIVNGSPRAKKNTAAMLESFKNGVQSVNPQAEIKEVSLYRLNYTGCRSCFACKLKGKTYGKSCAIKDDLHDILADLADADGIVMGSPIYFGEITGQLKAFIERMIFPYFTYEKGSRSIAPKHPLVIMIYTMNVTEEMYKELNYDAVLSNVENFVGHTFTKPKRLCAFNTYQFDRYDRYVVECFSESEKAEYKQKHFPEDCKKAFDEGADMAEQLLRKENL